MGLSCGNPTAYAHLRPGEVVVDLGCGGGLDVFLASAKVGAEGRAIGIDMTPEMIERARRNAEKGGYTNVEFHLASIDELPLEDNSVDCVISNCVINLAPDKQAVFREVARVLKPGGQLISISGPPDAAFARSIGASRLVRTIMGFLSYRITAKAKRRQAKYSFLFMRANGDQLTEITSLIDAGIISPVVDRVFPFASTKEAMAYVEAGRAKGKVVVSLK